MKFDAGGRRPHERTPERPAAATAPAAPPAGGDPAPYAVRPPHKTMIDAEGNEEGNRMSVPPEVSGPATVITDSIHFNTQGDADMVNITEEVRRLRRRHRLAGRHRDRLRAGGHRSRDHSRVRAGRGAGLPRPLQPRRPRRPTTTTTTTPIPDANGHAHVRAGLLGPSLVIPFDDGKLCLGRWQEIAFVCFDNRPRERTVVVQTLGVR